MTPRSGSSRRCLCAVAVGDLVRPALAASSRRSGRWSLLGLVACCAVAPISRAGSTSKSATGIPSRRSARPKVTRSRRASSPRASNASPTIVEGWRLLAASYMQLGRTTRAARHISELWTLTPRARRRAQARVRGVADPERPRGARQARRGASSRKCSRRSPATRRRSGTAGSSRSSSAARTRADALGAPARARILPTRSRAIVRGQLAALGGRRRQRVRPAAALPSHLRPRRSSST